MNFDEILLSAVLVMLIASTWMAWSMQSSLRRARESFEALVRQIGTMGLATIALDRKVESLEERIRELENERT
jgi:hypothetical protein